MFRPFRQLALALILIATLVASSGIQIPAGSNVKMLSVEILIGPKGFRWSLAGSMEPRKGTWV
jgi:hypothetical protein